MSRSYRRCIGVVLASLALAALACGPLPLLSKPTPIPEVVPLPTPPPAEPGEGDEVEPIAPPPPEQRVVSFDDIPLYPGAQRQIELESGWNAVDPETGEPFAGEVRLYTTADTPPAVFDFYEQNLSGSEWTSVGVFAGDDGGFSVWEHPAGYQLAIIVSAYEQDAQLETTIVLMFGEGENQAGEAGEQTQGTTGEGAVVGGLVTPAPDGSTMPPAGMGLLPTAALSMGLQGWEQWLQPGSRSPGQNVVQMASDPMFSQVVEFVRTDEHNDGGAAGIYQPLSLDVSGFPHLYVWLVGKVIAESGGNIGNTNPAWYPEGAVQVRITYLAASGQQAEWYHGFYAQPISGVDVAHFDQVPPGEWFRYAADLMTLPDPPAVITEVRVYGFGWEFQGQVADVNLIGATQ